MANSNSIFQIITKLKKMKKIIVIAAVVVFSVRLSAQNTLPASILSAIPAKYILASNSYTKVDPMVGASLSLEMPNKFGCSDLLKGDCEINIDIAYYIMSTQEAKDLVKHYSQYYKYGLPTAESHKGDNDNSTGSVKYSETVPVQVENGVAFYYTGIHSCIMDQYQEYRSVDFVSVQGSTEWSVKIRVVGNITPEEAISTARELYTILSHLKWE